MHENASLSDYVQLWVEKSAPHGAPRTRRLVALTVVAFAGAAVLFVFFALAYATVLGRFW